MPWDNDIECKAFEAATEQRAPRHLPLLVRLDGRAFHTYTRGLRRPYDERLSRCMVETTRTLVAGMHCAVGYTQSDEITLLFHADPTQPSSCLPFDGRIQKLASVLAGMASSRFAVLAYEALPDKRQYTPHFDGRAWSVPTVEDAVEAVQWRVDDATKNSVSMAAQSVYSHRQLLNKHTPEQIEMLRAKGVEWSDYPDFFRVGSFLRRVIVDVVLSDDERMVIPERHRPAMGAVVQRGHVVEVTAPAKLTWQWLTTGI